MTLPRTLILLLLLFALSTALRWRQFTPPLANEQESVTALALIPLRAWTAQGMLSSYGAPLQTMEGPANRFVVNSGIRLFSPDGRGFYTSAPPGSLLAAYALFKLINIEPSVTALRILNTGLHLSAALLLFFLILIVAGPSGGGLFSSVAALSGCTVFIFLPSNLWHFTNIYSWDTFWIYPWLLALFFLGRLISAVPDSSAHRRAFWGLAFSSALTNYCDFQGVFFSVVVFATSFLFGSLSRRGAWSYLLLAALPVLLTCTQYSQIAGVGPFFEELLSRGVQRSCIQPESGSFNRLLLIYDYAYFGAALALLLAWLRLRLGRVPLNLNSVQKQILLILALMIAVHHAAFFNWTVHHEYSALKSGVLAALLWAFVTRRLLDSRAFLTAGLMLLVFISDALIMYQRHYTAIPERGFAQQLGQEIDQQAQPDEVVFLKTNHYIWSPVMYYAARNIAAAGDREQVRAWLTSHRRKKGVLLHTDEHGRLVKVEHIHVSE